MTEQTPKVNTAPGFLAGALSRKRAEVAALRPVRPLGELVAAAADRPPVRSLAAALRAPGVSIVAEVKRASPSAGPLAPGIDAGTRARLYQERGAAAISVLTDAAFHGRLADLTAVAAGTSVPVVRKDFLVDRWQIWESRVAGADAALLVVAALEPDEIAAMAAEAAAAGLELLVEIHAPAEIPLAVSIAAPIMGVNARDLSSLEVDLETALSTVRALRREAPEAILLAESGIAGPDDVRRAGSAGADAVLVGEHLARAPDAGRALARLVMAGRGPQ